MLKAQSNRTARRSQDASHSNSCHRIHHSTFNHRQRHKWLYSQSLEVEEVAAAAAVSSPLLPLHLLCARLHRSTHKKFMCLLPEYENVGSATTPSAGDDEPPLVTATPITTEAAMSSSLPTVAEAINTTKLNATQQREQQETSEATGRFPTTLNKCPACHTSQITTRIRTYPSCVTWTVVAILFLVFWPVCWIPLVIDTCKSTDHYCTHCSNVVGKVEPLSDCCVKEMG